MKNEEDHDEDQQVALELLERTADKIKDEPQPSLEIPPLLFSKRLFVTIMLFLCYVNFQVLRNNMNIAIVEMISNKTIIQGNENTTQLAEFNWDSTTAGVVTSIINYGGQLAFANGFLINKMGASTSSGVCMLLAGITTFLHPVSLQLGFYVFLAIRFFTGILEAVFYSSTPSIASMWFPLQERSTLIAHSMNGINVGVALVYPFCGYLAHTWGWRMVFYVTGLKSVLVSICFLILVKNHPSQDSNISKAEVAYILRETEVTSLTPEKHNNTSTMKEKLFQILSVFKLLLTSGPIWALFTLIFTYMWIASVISACLPSYFKDVTGKNSDEIGYISFIPNAVYIFMFPITGALMDYWKNHSNVTTATIHKTLLSIAYISSVVFFIAITYVTDLTTILAFFVSIQIFTPCAPLIISIMTVSLAPNHVSHVSSFCTNFFSLGAVLVQTVSGIMTPNHTFQEWNNSFILAAGIAIFGNLMVLMFGSSDAQKWSLSPPLKEANSLTDKSLRTNGAIGC
ncbi:sialin-like [Planococcus citri]|uniref:sialin-like n=1 Tax=Planococcus citri TaxID=170843 RepID=UPI0031F9A8BE